MAIPSTADGIALAHRLAAETDGNPFFVTEVLRHLVETGALVQVDGVWVGTVAPGEAGLPEGVRDVVGQRLSRLSPETNDLLRTAAVFGREFDDRPGRHGHAGRRRLPRSTNSTKPSTPNSSTRSRAARAG